MIILIDPGTHIHQVPVSEDRNSKKCRIIVFSSPKVSSYRTFIKYCKLTLFMPLWNLEEIEHCRFQRPRFLCLLLLRRALPHSFTEDISQSKASQTADVLTGIVRHIKKKDLWKYKAKFQKVVGQNKSVPLQVIDTGGQPEFHEMLF